MTWPAELARKPDRHLRALVSCEAVSDELPFIVDGNRRPSPALDEHLRTCLSCQAELVGYRRLLRALRALRDQPAPSAVPELLGATLNALHRHPSWPVGKGPKPWMVVAAMATAGAVAISAGAFLALGRHSRALAA